MKIAIVVGSINSDSINRVFANRLAELFPDDTEVYFPDIKLPLHSRDLESAYPEEATRFKDQLAEADGVLIVTPEYNRSVPAVLKNAIDWASRPWEDQPFRDKPVAIAGMSTGATGTAQAQQHLRNTLVYFNARLMGQPELYLQNSRVLTDDGDISESALSHVQSFVTAFYNHVAREGSI